MNPRPPDKKEGRRGWPKGWEGTAMADKRPVTLFKVGDPLDIKMFESTGWVLEEADNKFDALMATVVRPDKRSESGDEADLSSELQAPEIGIIKQFTFSSTVARFVKAACLG